MAFVLPWRGVQGLDGIPLWWKENRSRFFCTIFPKYQHESLVSHQAGLYIVSLEVLWGSIERTDAVGKQKLLYGSIFLADWQTLNKCLLSICNENISNANITAKTGTKKTALLKKQQQQLRIIKNNQEYHIVFFFNTKEPLNCILLLLLLLLLYYNRLRSFALAYTNQAQYRCCPPENSAVHL